jgi:hypothetical protein
MDGFDWLRAVRILKVPMGKPDDKLSSNADYVVLLNCERIGLTRAFFRSVGLRLPFVFARYGVG